MPILDISQYITLSDSNQYYTRMRPYFHCQHNHFIDYFDDPIPDDAVIYAEYMPFWYHESEGMHKEFLDNPTGNGFLVANRDHELQPFNHLTQ